MVLILAPIKKHAPIMPMMSSPTSRSFRITPIEPTTRALPAKAKEMAIKSAERDFIVRFELIIVVACSFFGFLCVCALLALFCAFGVLFSTLLVRFLSQAFVFDLRVFLLFFSFLE